MNAWYLKFINNSYNSTLRTSQLKKEQTSKQLRLKLIYICHIIYIDILVHEKFSAVFSIGELQIRTTMRHHHIYILKMTKINTSPTIPKAMKL